MNTYKQHTHEPLEIHNKHILTYYTNTDSYKHSFFPHTIRDSIINIILNNIKQNHRKLSVGEVTQFHDFIISSAAAITRLATTSIRITRG